MSVKVAIVTAGSVNAAVIQALIKHGLEVETVETVQDMDRLGYDIELFPNFNTRLDTEPNIPEYKFPLSAVKFASLYSYDLITARTKKVRCIKKKHSTVFKKLNKLLQSLG